MYTRMHARMQVARSTCFTKHMHSCVCLLSWKIHPGYTFYTLNRCRTLLCPLSEE